MIKIWNLSYKCKYWKKIMDSYPFTVLWKFCPFTQCYLRLTRNEKGRFYLILKRFYFSLSYLHQRWAWGAICSFGSLVNPILPQISQWGTPSGWSSYASHRPPFDFLYFGLDGQLYGFGLMVSLKRHIRSLLTNI